MPLDSKSMDASGKLVNVASMLEKRIEEYEHTKSTMVKLKISEARDLVKLLYACAVIIDKLGMNIDDGVKGSEE